MEVNLKRIENYIKEFPDTEIWVISGNGIQAKLYWKKIKEITDVKTIKPYIFSKNIYTIDGLNPQKALIILCGRWYLNPVADSNIFKQYLRQARFTMPISEIPSLKAI